MRSSAFFVLLGILGWAAAASAAIPSPGNSFVDPCLFACPRGDVPFHVTIRDLVNQPIPGAAVQVVLCSDTLHMCPVDSCLLVGTTDAAGSVTFVVRGGGSVYAPVVVSADGVIIRFVRVSSPDQNGDLVVDATDLAIGSAKVGMADPTMDLDCDQNTVDAQDVAVLQTHLGHVCPGPTPVRSTTWGRLKTIYR